MRVLITGARGQVGQSLRERIPEDWEVIFTDSKTLDITNEQSVQAMVQGFQPDVIINTAAYTNVDQAEIHTELAFAVNAHGVGHLAKAAQHVQARLIHLSTDYVFDGLKSQPYTIWDTPNPNNIYGKSKLAGELLALSLCESTTIIRTSWVFSQFGSNFIPAIIRKLLKEKTVFITDDNIGTPTHAGSLAQYIIDLIELKSPPKMLHYCGNTVIGRVDLAHLIAEQLSSVTSEKYLIERHVLPGQTVLKTKPQYSALLSNLAVGKPELPLSTHLYDLAKFIHQQHC